MFFQSLPNLDHCVGIEAAVGKEGLACGDLLCRLHILDLWEDGHGVATILTTFIEVVIVERGLVGPEGWQHVFDAGRASHSGYVIVASLEGIPQVNDVVTDIQQVVAEVRDPVPIP